MQITEKTKSKFISDLKKELSSLCGASNEHSTYEIIRISNHDNINRQINKSYDIIESDQKAEVLVAFGLDSQKLVTIVEIVKKMMREKNIIVDYDDTNNEVKERRIFKNKYEQYNKLYSVVIKKESPNESKSLNKSQKQEILMRKLDEDYFPCIEIPVLVCLIKKSVKNNDEKLALTNNEWSSQVI